MIAILQPLSVTWGGGGEEVGGGGSVGKKLRGLEEEVVEDVPKPRLVDPRESVDVGEGRMWLPTGPIGCRGGIGGGG